MNEIPQILEQKEKIIWEGKPKYAPYITSVILSGLLIGLFAGIWLGQYFKTIILGVIMGIIFLAGSIIIGQLKYNFTHYALSNRRAIYQSGIFGRNFKSINYDEIKNASVYKGFFNWIFGTGTIQVFTGEMESTGGKNHHIRPKYDNFLYLEGSYEVLKELQTHLTEMEENLYGGKNVVQQVRVVN
jgi:hypothetical protein